MAGGSPDGVSTSRLLSLAYNAISSAIYRGLKEAGISDIRPSHGNVMEHLTFENGLRLNDLASRAGVTPQSMGQFVDELEALGYVERRPDPVDRRAKRIHLTGKGKRSTDSSWRVIAEVEETVKKILGKKKLHDLRNSLARIIDGLDT